MKYHALSVIFEKAAKFQLSSAVNYRWRFKGLYSEIECSFGFLIRCVNGRDQINK